MHPDDPNNVVTPYEQAHTVRRDVEHAAVAGLVGVAARHSPRLRRTIDTLIILGVLALAVIAVVSIIEFGRI